MKKKIISPLPVVFICVVLIIAILNMNSFTTLYKTKIIEAKPTNKQAVLSTLESSYTDSFVGKNNYIDINGLFARLVDKKELNERYKLNNSFLTGELQAYNNMTSAINNITTTKEYLELYDIPFAYIQTPHLTPIDDDPMIPAGYETHINGNSDRLLNGLAENGVDYLDLRENFKEDGISHYDIFYRTDHHWNTEAGFTAHKYVAELIDEMLGEELLIGDYFDLDNYDTEIYKNKFLGSHGKRTGVFYAGVDDILLITPAFETSFTVETPINSSKVTGDFSKTQINYTILNDNLTSPYSKNEYTVYPLHSDYSKIVNHNATNDKVIVLFRDSFTGILAPFLALHYKEVHLLDTRYGAKEEGFIQRLHEVQPDLVLQIRVTSSPLTTEAKQELQDAQKN